MPEQKQVEVRGTQTEKKRTQEEIITDVPVIVHEHAIPKEELRCGNENLTCIGMELAYTEYVRIPAHVDRHENYVEKYACHNCEIGMVKCRSCEHTDARFCASCPGKPGMIVIAAKLPDESRHLLIRGSKASSSISSQIYYDKFELDFPLSRQSMNNWILRIYKDYLQAMNAYMLKILKRAPPFCTAMRLRSRYWMRKMTAEFQRNVICGWYVPEEEKQNS